MSISAISWAFEQRSLKDPTARHVLLALANYADKLGRNAYPAAATLARDTGLSERTVRLKLDHLRTAGMIRPGDQHSAHRISRADRRPVVYDLVMQRAEGPAPRRGAAVEGYGVLPEQERGEQAAPDPKALTNYRATSYREGALGESNEDPIRQVNAARHCSGLLSDAGFFCSPEHPKLIEFLGAGGSCTRLLELGRMLEYQGKPAGYLIAIALRELSVVPKVKHRSQRTDPRVTAPPSHESPLVGVKNPKTLGEQSRSSPQVDRALRSEPQHLSETALIAIADCRRFLGYAEH